MSRLLYACSLACPLIRLFIPRHRSSRPHLGNPETSGSWDGENGSVVIEMGDLSEFKRNEMEVFERTESSTVDEPFDPTIDHFRILSQYSPQKKLLIISIIEAGGECDVARCSSSQIRLALLSDKVIKKNTSFAPGPKPKFNETFAFKLDEEKLQTTVLRFRLYKKRMPKRSQLIGEAYLKGRKIGPHSIHLLKIRPPIATSAKKKTDLLAVIENGDVIGSRISHEIHEVFSPSPLKSNHNNSLVHQQCSTSSNSNGKNSNLMKKISQISAIEVLIVLAYSDVQDSFRIGIEKVAKIERLIETDGKPMDCYFQLIVRSDGAELCRHRTKTINCTGEIDLDEFVVVSASLREIHDITVIIGFFCLQGFLKKRTLLGWIRLGADELESVDAADHWMHMIHDIGRSVERWHQLRRPKNFTL